MSDIGAYALRFALLIAVIGLCSGVYAGVKRRPDWTRVSERCVWAVFILVSVGMLSLFYAFVTSDFQLLYVARHSARSMPLQYRLAVFTLFHQIKKEIRDVVQRWSI